MIFHVSSFNILLHTFVSMEKLFQLLIDPIYMSDRLIIVIYILTSYHKVPEHDNQT